MSYFVTLEGCEGSGKSTIMQLLAEALVEQGYDFIYTREPGGIEIAEQIRSVILDKANTKMDAKTEALLYAAARRQHLIEKIIPALEAGKLVLCDRFIDSSLAYQGYARGLGMEEIYTINKFAVENYMPNLTLYLDIAPETGMKRIQQDGKREINRLDLESMNFHTKVREGYHKLLKQEPKRIKCINAENNVETVYLEALKELLAFLKQQ